MNDLTLVLVDGRATHSLGEFGPDDPAMLDVLCQMKQGVQQGRWIKGALSNEEGKCMVGYVLHTTTDKVQRHKLLDLLSSCLPMWAHYKAHGLNSHPIPTFNDDPGTTQDDVIAVIDRAAEKLRNQ